MKEGGTSLNKTFREYNLVFKRLNIVEFSNNNLEGWYFDNNSMIRKICILEPKRLAEVVDIL